MSSEDPPFFNEGNQTVIEQQPDYGSDHFDEPEENLVQSNNTLQEQVDAPATENGAQSGTRASAGDGTYATLGPQGSGNVDQPEGNRLIPPDINDPNSLIFWEMKVRQEDTDHHKHLTLEDILWNLHEARVTDANYQQVFESTVLKEISNYIKSGPKGVKSHAVGPDKPWFYSQAHRNNLLQGWFSDWMRLPEGKVHFMHFQSAQELGRSELTHQLLYMPSGAYYEDTAGKVWYIPNGYLWIGEFTKDSIFNIFEYFQQEIDRDLLNVFWRKIAPIAFFSIEKYKTDMSELREEYNQLVQEPNFDNAPNKQTLPAGFLVVLKDIQTMNIYRVSEGVWVDDISDLPLGYTSQRITKVYGESSVAFAISTLLPLLKLIFKLNVSKLDRREFG